MNGHTQYVKDFSVDTGNKVLSQSNVESYRQITFEGLDGGNMVSDESLLIDTVGMPTSSCGPVPLSVWSVHNRRHFLHTVTLCRPGAT